MLEGGGVAAATTASSSLSLGTLSEKRTCTIVERPSPDTRGSSAVSGFDTATPGIASSASTTSATVFSLAESVIRPEVAVISTCPVVPVRPKRSASTSWPCCDCVPGMTNPSS